MTAFRTNLCVADPGGVQVVRVSVYSPGVFATTEVSVGSTENGGALTT